MKRRYVLRIERCLDGTRVKGELIHSLGLGLRLGVQQTANWGLVSKIRQTADLGIEVKGSTSD